MKVKICFVTILVIAILVSGCLDKDVLYVRFNMQGGIVATQIDIQSSEYNWQKYNDNIFVSNTNNILIDEQDCYFSMRVTDYEIQRTDTQIKINGHVQTINNKNCTLNKNPSLIALVHDKDGKRLADNMDNPYELQMKPTEASQPFIIQINYK